MRLICLRNLGQCLAHGRPAAFLSRPPCPPPSPLPGNAGDLGAECPGLVCRPVKWETGPCPAPWGRTWGQASPSTPPRHTQRRHAGHGEQRDVLTRPRTHFGPSPAMRKLASVCQGRCFVASGPSPLFTVTFSPYVSQQILYVLNTMMTEKSTEALLTMSIFFKVKIAHMLYWQLENVSFWHHGWQISEIPCPANLWSPAFGRP